MMSFPVRASLLILLVTSAGQLQAQGDAQPPRVSVVAAYQQEITEETNFIGRVEAVDKVEVVARVAGYVRNVVVSDGATVSAGELLFEIEPDQYQATLDAREAELAKAEADIELTRIELDRKRQLVERNAIPQSELDIARANEAVAEANILSAKAGIKQAELDLSYTAIRAPFDGQVGRIAASIGDFVGPTTGALTTLVRTEPIFVSFSVSETQLADIREEQIARGTASDAPPPLAVRVTLPNGSLLDEVGHLDFGENLIDPATGTLAVRARFDNTKGLLLDGGFVTVRIAGEAPVQETLVPQAAVQQDQRGPFVLVVNEAQTVEQRYIATGSTVGTAIIVADGLVAGEAVIVEGLQRVRPGVPVQAVTAGAASTAQEG